MYSRGKGEICSTGLDWHWMIRTTRTASIGIQKAKVTNTNTGTEEEAARMTDPVILAAKSGTVLDVGAH